MKRLVLWISLIVLVCAGIASAQGGVKKKRPPGYEYGNVTINNFSANAGLAPVVFQHWSHRSRFTCRVCHVDIGFAMKAGATRVRAADNMKGYYCGTCHNGSMQFNKEKVFEACSKVSSSVDQKRCNKCHFVGDTGKREEEFYKFADDLPKERFGNGIDWEKAEEEGLVKPVDFIKGVSVKRPPLPVQKDFALAAKVEGMPEIIFSHKKHTVWNGCEVCHPEIFIGIKKGSTKYSMIEIFEGKYCGVCHDKVAFPQMGCQRCHTKPVS
ncbi:MAG TPA: c(7)-type cytochrome triheme domain-containing protein [Geobacteraceae bacterium]|nr:c(7)-type cytochrome triheme domain-containing protein [Geobacteraceae bacterium]